MGAHPPKSKQCGKANHRETTNRSRGKRIHNSLTCCSDSNHSRPHPHRQRHTLLSPIPSVLPMQPTPHDEPLNSKSKQEPIRQINREDRRQSNAPQSRAQTPERMKWAPGGKGRTAAREANCTTHEEPSQQWNEWAPQLDCPTQTSSAMPTSHESWRRVMNN